VKPVAAAPISDPNVIPTNNVVNTKTTYDIFFRTATAGMIKFILMTFPSDFDISGAPRLVERSGIGSGSVSPPSNSTLIYTLSNPVNVPAGTLIRLEIGRIVNSNIAGSFRASISTEDSIGNVIDGPTLSSSFRIKDITGDDISPDFMVRKTMYDDDAGHAHGWDPDASTTSYAIFDSDITGASDDEFVSVMVRYGNAVYCTAATADTGLFVVHCNSAPGDSAVLDYIITRLPSHVVTSTVVSSSITASPFASLQRGH